jgi:hypothetical protein
LSLQAGRIGDDEKIDEFEGMDEDEVDAIMKQREAQGRAQILEMVSFAKIDGVVWSAHDTMSVMRLFDCPLTVWDLDACRLETYQMPTSNRQRTCCLCASSTL